QREGAIMKWVSVFNQKTKKYEQYKVTSDGVAFDPTGRRLMTAEVKPFAVKWEQNRQLAAQAARGRKSAVMLPATAPRPKLAAGKTLEALKPETPAGEDKPAKPSFFARLFGRTKPDVPEPRKRKAKRRAPKRKPSARNK